MNLCFTETIKDYPGYLITRDGRVISLTRKVLTSKGNYMKVNGRILKHGNDTCGYSSVVLCEKGKVKVCRIHRLVAEAFLLNPENKKEINHKDGNKQNNHLSNLEWSTRSENCFHAYKELKRKLPKSAFKKGRKYAPRVKTLPESSN